MSAPGDIVAEVFGLAEAPQLTPRYNIAPTQPAPAVLIPPDRSDRAFRPLHWGLIPSWAKDPGIGARMINARAETVFEKPAFRAAARHRRCLILADGFYEWQRIGRGKRPYYVTMRDGSLFAFAGLWEHWEGPQDRPIESCTILTTEPNDLIRPIHDRMPVILEPPDHHTWLDPSCSEKRIIASLIKTIGAIRLTAHPVSAFVNNPANDSRRCVEKVQ